MSNDPEARSFRLSSHDVVVEGVLGQGGMGTVYRVREQSLGRPAALKLIRGQQDPRRSRRFAREVLVTALLDHPNIPPVYEVGRTATGEELAQGAPGASATPALCGEGPRAETRDQDP